MKRTATAGLLGVALIVLSTGACSSRAARGRGAAAPARCACAPSAGSVHGGTTPPNGKPYDAMFFQNHGTNPFVDADVDRLSTFAVDVDDASFALCRTYLHDGNRPDADAVRVEEFVNHFDYGYEAPPDGPFAMTAAAAPSPFGKDLVLLRFAVKGREIAEDARKPAVLTFVIDTSGSMAEGNRLGLVRQSLEMLVDRLKPDDSVGIVTFDTDARVLLEPTPRRLGGKIRDAVRGLKPDGSTNTDKGLRVGYEMASRSFRRDALNRVLLLTDGVANVGTTDADGIWKEIEAEAKKGIYLSAIGVGAGNYNDVLLERLGNRGNGHYAYLDSVDVARRLFGENLTGTLQVIGRDVKAQVEFEPDVVRSYRLLGYEDRDVKDEDFRNDLADGGEVGAGHSVTALYEVRLWPGKSGRIAMARLRWTDPDDGSVHERGSSIATGDVATRFESAPPDVRLAAAAAEFAEVLRGSYWAKDGSLAAVEDVVRGIPAPLSDHADVVELRDLLAKARRAEAKATPKP